MQVRLPRPLPGSVLLRRAGVSGIGFKDDEPELESIQFNRQTEVFERPRGMAHRLLTPDFMDWYLHSPVKPWIHVKNNDVSVALEGDDANDHLDQLAELLRTVVRFVERSGALVDRAIQL
jgi:hypothetical protein